jgi:hypothetical protein
MLFELRTQTVEKPVAIENSNQKKKGVSEHDKQFIVEKAGFRSALRNQWVRITITTTSQNEQN